MSAERTRERIIEAIRKMQENTVDKGCTPAEAAMFAAKAAEWIEKFQVDEAELRATKGEGDDFDVCQNFLRTGKKVFNPGMTQVVQGLATGMCCKVVLLPVGWNNLPEATYGIVGDSMDADYVCQIATTVVPALQVMATWEGREHGYEKAGLVRWCNQYLTGAGQTIRQRLERDRQERADLKLLEHHLADPSGSTALVPITGITIAEKKREMVAEVFKAIYPTTRKTTSHSSYNPTAQERGREAGRTVPLNIQIGHRIGPDGRIADPI